MKLKCIGGPRNGHHIEIDDYYKEHDQVRVMGVMEYDVLDFEESLRAFRENRVPDNVCIQYHYYKIAVLRFSKTDTIKFLIPITSKIEDAVRWALT